MVDDHRIRPGQNGPSEFLRRLLPPEGRRIHHRQAHPRYGIQGAADGIVLIAGDHHPAAGNHQRPDGDVQPVGSVHGEHHILRRRHAEQRRRLGPTPEGRLLRPAGGGMTAPSGSGQLCRRLRHGLPRLGRLFQRGGRSVQIDHVPASCQPLSVRSYMPRGVSPAVCKHVWASCCR